MAWDDLSAAVHAEKLQVVRCWHPEPQGELIALRNGVNVEVKEGQPAYQLSNGAVVAL